MNVQEYLNRIRYQGCSAPNLQTLTALQAAHMRAVPFENLSAQYQEPLPGLIYHTSPAPEFFMALPFGEEAPMGKVEFHKAFYVSA